MSETVSINKVKKGHYFKRKPEAKTVYVRGVYCRGYGCFSCQDTEDMNREVFIKSGKAVFIDFEY